MVALGAAGNEIAHRIYHEETFFGGLAVSSYRFSSALSAARPEHAAGSGVVAKAATG
jgi:hypothetical protein